MKKLFLPAFWITVIYAFDQKPVNVYRAPAVPESLLTTDSVYWTTAGLPPAGNTRAASVNYKTAESMVIKLKFYKENRFRLLLYMPSNSYGTETETWTETEGSVEFTKDAKGQNVFVMTAEKGINRVTKNGKTATSRVSASELKTEYSNTYLWERINFPDDPHHTYLLTVNLDEHPGADVNTRGSIDHAWVSKFYIPVTR